MLISFLSIQIKIVVLKKRKCDVYYPNVDEDESDLEMNFGKFQISYLSEQPFEDYVIRRLEVENLDVISLVLFF